jgi:E3 ubiquitin-protein ligase MYCBP2
MSFIIRSVGDREKNKFSGIFAQVCLHIVQAIKKESSRMRDDWEVSLCSGAPAPTNGDDLLSMPDTYCFEMLSLVLALSGSSVGRSYLASQFGLIVDLLTLLHTGKPPA